MSKKAEHQKLVVMLADGKITQDEFHLLTQALEKPRSSGELLFIGLVCPFESLAGQKGLVSGAVITLLLCLVGVWAQVHFPGALDLKLAADPLRTIDLSLQLLLFESVINAGSLALVFWVLAKLNKQAGLRLTDFFGMLATARYPYLLTAFAIGVWGLVDPSIKGGLELTPNNIAILASLGIVGLIWQIAAYFQALRVASGLAGRRLWVSFLVGLVLAEAFSLPIIHLLITSGV